MEEGKLHDLLSREGLLQMTDGELYEVLSREPDPELQKYLEKMDSNDHAYQSIYLTKDTLPSSSGHLSIAKKFPIVIKTGLQSRVVNANGQELSLQEYVEINPSEDFSKWIKQGIGVYQHKYLALLRRDSLRSLLDDEVFHRGQVTHGENPLDILDEEL